MPNWILFEIKTAYNGRSPQNIKVEYPSNHWSDLPQILDLSLGDQMKIENCFKWRWPPMEDNFKILKVEYLSILKPVEMQKASNKRWL